MGVIAPPDPMPEAVFYRNGARSGRKTALHPRGEGILRPRTFGPIPLRTGRLPRVPIGTTGRLAPDAGQPPQRAEDALPGVPVGVVRPPQALPPTYGQLARDRLFAAEDIRPLPDEVPDQADEGEFRVHVRCANADAYHYTTPVRRRRLRTGYLWPIRVNIGDFEPITGRVNQRPPSTAFAALNFVGVLVRCHRKFDLPPAGDQAARTTTRTYKNSD